MSKQKIQKIISKKALGRRRKQIKCWATNHIDVNRYNRWNKLGKQKIQKIILSEGFRWKGETSFLQESVTNIIFTYLLATGCYKPVNLLAHLFTQRRKFEVASKFYCEQILFVN